MSQTVTGLVAGSNTEVSQVSKWPATSTAPLKTA